MYVFTGKWPERMDIFRGAPAKRKQQDAADGDAGVVQVVAGHGVRLRHTVNLVS